MICTHMLNMEDGLTIGFVGHTQDIQSLSFFISQNSRSDLLYLDELASWLIMRKVYAGVIEFPRTAKAIYSRKVFEKKMKTHGLFIDKEDFLEGLFLQCPEYFTKLLGESEDVLINGLKNQHWLEEFGVQQTSREK